MPTARPAGTARSAELASLALVTGWRFDFENHVAGLQHACGRAVGIHIGDHRAARICRNLELPRKFGRDVVQRDAEPAAGVAPGCPRQPDESVSFSRFNSSTLTLSVRSLPSRMTFTGTVVPGAVAATC